MSPLDTPDYQEFIRSVQPIAVGLNSSAASLDRIAFWRSLEKEEPEVTHSLEVQYKSSAVADDSFSVIADLKLATRPTETEHPFLSMTCQFDAHFHAERVTEEFATKFANFEARLILWPFLREFVSNVTTRMAIPPILLPLAFRSDSTTPSTPESTRASAESGGTHSKRKRRTLK
jgi:preprotein translocase subunit SecB